MNVVRKSGGQTFLLLNNVYFPIVSSPVESLLRHECGPKVGGSKCVQVKKCRHIRDQSLKSNKVENGVLWTHWCILCDGVEAKFDQTLLGANAFRLSYCKTLQRPYQILDWYWLLAFLWQNNNIAKCVDGRDGEPHLKGSKFLVSKWLYCFSPDWLEKPPHSSHFPKCYSKRHQKPFVRQMSCRSWEKVAVKSEFC